MTDIDFKKLRSEANYRLAWVAVKVLRALPSLLRVYRSDMQFRLSIERKVLSRVTLKSISTAGRLGESPRLTMSTADRTLDDDLK